jgi:hypothetical protein
LPELTLVDLRFTGVGPRGHPGLRERLGAGAVFG